MKILISALLALGFFSPDAHATLSVGLAKKYARVIYDVSLNGGASTSHALDAVLPAGALIGDVWVYINTAFTDGGTSSVALECGGTRNIMEWQDMAAQSVNGLHAARRSATNFTQSSTTFTPESTTFNAVGISSVPTDCEVTAVVRSDSGYAPYTGGKLTALIEYFQ